MKKFLSAIAMCLLCVYLFAACGGPIEIGGFDYSAAGTNTDKTFRITGAWTKTGVGTHFHSGPDAGPIIMYCLEGCMQYVRTTTDFYYLLAESFEHKDDGTSIIHIRENAKWFDGEPVVAMDILCYYVMCVTDFSKNCLNMEVVDENDNGDLTDDKALKVYWKPWREPATDYVKNMLLAMDTKNGSVPYHIFKEYVDATMELIYDEGNPEVTETNDGQGEERLGRKINAVSAAIGEQYNAFRAHIVGGDNSDATKYVGTGPFRPSLVTENQMVLVKNEDYYLADEVGFDKIIATQYSNDNQRIADMKAGKLDYVDGVQPEDINKSILNGNKNMVSYKYYDQGAIGMYYNLEKDMWQNDKVREAFQYILDRDTIRSTVMPYGITSYRPQMIMSPIEARQYMSPEAYAMIAEYSYDQAKAEQLLKEAGWTKTDGQWRDEDGKAVTITIGYENSTTFLKCAQIVKAQLDNFGIPVTLKSGNDWGTWFSTASSANSLYDAVVAFTELNTFGTHPAGSMKHFFDILQAHVLHIPTDASTGKFALQVDLLDPYDKTQSTGKIDCYTVYQHLYAYEGTELTNYVDSIILGYSKFNYGIQFFENVTGSYFDASRIAGLPAADLMAESRDILTIPDFFEEEYQQFAILNAAFTQAGPVAYGQLSAKI